MSIRYKLELEATKVPTDMDIAWAAGFYEGEGNCSNRVSKACVGCTQKDPEMLYKLRDWFGGRVYFARWKGHAETPEKNCYNWKAYGDRARWFLALVYPFLSTKRRAQADATNILEFLGGLSPESLTRDQIGSLLNSKLPFCPKGDPQTAEKKAYQKSQAYLRRREDSAFVEKCRTQSSQGNARLRLQKRTADSQPERIM